MFTAFNQQLLKYTHLSPEELERINQFYKPITAPKKAMLLQPGEVCRFEAVVAKGCLISYISGENAQPLILQFATENWWISDITSFHEQKPSRMYIEALEDCELLTLSLADKEAMLKEFPRLERVFRLLLQRNLGVYHERLFATVVQSAEQRYQDFLERYPAIPQRVPQHLIAAYLGITPEFLSRIRQRQKLKKE
jgi:CRP/FNR family cyclic AMP-dependent transcriptional regulator